MRRVGVELLPLDNLRHRLAEELGEVVPALRRGVARREARAEPLVHLAKIVEPRQLLELEPVDDDAAIGMAVDEAELGEAVERIARQEARHVELARDLP